MRLPQLARCPTRFKTTLAAAATAAIAALSTSAFAAHDLPAGDTGSPVASPFPAGFSTANLLISSTSTVTSGAFTGTFRSAVYTSFATAADALNPGFTAGAATLDFVYQFSNSAASSTSIGRLSFFDFASGGVPNQFAVLAWDQAGDPDGAGMFLAGTQEADNAQRGVNGGAISLNYGDGLVANKIDPGETSFAILLRVNTSNYASGLFSA